LPANSNAGVQGSERGPRAIWREPRPPDLRYGQTRLVVRTRFDGRLRDLGRFNLAIDSKPRGCDVLALDQWHYAERPCGGSRVVSQNATFSVAFSADDDVLW